MKFDKPTKNVNAKDELTSFVVEQEASEPNLTLDLQCYSFDNFTLRESWRREMYFSMSEYFAKGQEESITDFLNEYVIIESGADKFTYREMVGESNLSNVVGLSNEDIEIADKLTYKTFLSSVVNSDEQKLTQLIEQGFFNKYQYFYYFDKPKSLVTIILESKFTNKYELIRAFLEQGFSTSTQDLVTAIRVDVPANYFQYLYQNKNSNLSSIYYVESKKYSLALHAMEFERLDILDYLIDTGEVLDVGVIDKNIFDILLNSSKLESVQKLKYAHKFINEFYLLPNLEDNVKTLREILPLDDIEPLIEKRNSEYSKLILDVRFLSRLEEVCSGQLQPDTFLN